MMLRQQLIIRCILLLLCLPMSIGGFAQPDGKALFKANCKTCHNANMKSDMTGPALGGVQERWGDYPEADLYAWIRNSVALADAGHPKAVEMINWAPSAMNSFTNLKDEEIASILTYIDDVYTGKIGGKPTPAEGDAAATPAQDEPADNTYLIVLLVSLGILALVLTRIVGNLNRMAQVKQGKEVEQKTLLDTLTSKSLLYFVAFVFFVMAGYSTVRNGTSLGRQQNYAPAQPIKFSHATHAGVNKIDCKYCHDGARRSKHSVIPAVNTCMNCHKNIVEGSKYGRTEISKIFAAAGFDPTAQGGGAYIEDYENKSKKDIEGIFKRWLRGGYEDAIANEEYTAEQVKKKVEEELKPIMAQAKKPIEWIRIHNLPDHAYFNHAQHVTVGKVECQTCHGAVEEMEVVRQYSPLSMGWCINCHRETKVQFADNPYYEAYDQYHKDLKNKKMDKVTVEHIGGLECQKCHY